MECGLVSSRENATQENVKLYIIKRKYKRSEYRQELNMGTIYLVFILSRA